MKFRTLILLLFTLISVTAEGKNDSARVIYNSYFFKLGSSQLKDSYLSVIPYKGIEYGAGFENIRDSRFKEHKWATRHLLEAEMAQTYNQRKNSYMMNFMFDYEFDYYRKYNLPCRLKLFVGGNMLLNFGSTYTGIGNNPASAKASLNFGVAAMASYTLKIRNYPITIKNNFSLPTIGTFFCPQYGVSYYEMFYLGNKEDWIHFGWWGNNLYISNKLTLDLPVKRRSVNIGYQCKFRSINQNHLIYKNLTHEFILGISVQKIIIGKNKKEIFPNLIMF